MIGQGYVGLPLAIRAHECGHDVVGFDLDVRRVDRLRSGDSYVEDVSSAALREALATGRYVVSADPSVCAGFDVAVITVPTPLRDSLPDLSFIESAARAVAQMVRPGCTVILESTTYPGTTEEVMIPILEEGSGLMAGSDFHVGYSPERIDPGNRSHTFVTTPKVVSGIDLASLEAVRAFYAGLIDRVIPVSSCKVAELTKLLENTFRHVNIALVNELAMFAGELGIDVWEAIDAAATKPFGFMRFTPGPGVGGHCLPIDPAYLSWRVRQSLNRSFRFVELAMDINDHMPEYVVERITRSLNHRRLPVAGTRITALGIAYKANTGDARESPATQVISLLRGLEAEITVVDPHVRDLPATLVGSVPHVALSDTLLQESDLVVLLTDHADFDYRNIAAKAAHVFDTRRRFPAGANVEWL